MFTFDSHKPRNFRKKTSLTLIKTKIGWGERDRDRDRERERESEREREGGRERL